MPSANYPDSGGRQLIDRVALASVLSYTSPTWAAGQFRRIEFGLYLTTTDGTAQPTVTMTGLGGTYKTQITFSSPGAASGFADTTHWNTGILGSGELWANVLIAPGAKRALLGQAFSGTTAFTISAENSDTAGLPTNLVITFTTTAAVGLVEVWG